MTQKPSVSALSGETVKISCTLSGGRVSGFYNSWYKQKPGSAPVMLIYSDDDRALGISDRFSGSLDSSANAAILTISNVQAGDEASYYCLYHDGSVQHTMIQPYGEERSALASVNSESDLVWFREDGEQKDDEKTSGRDAQFTMTQPSSVSASVGETVKVTCTRSSGSISSFYNSWYQQKPGCAPIRLIYAHRSRASGISDRFSGSIDSSASAAVLTISNVQAEDEADYYCASYDSNILYTMIQPHREVGQNPLCSRCALHGLCLADAPAESPVTSLVNSMQQMMVPHMCLVWVMLRAMLIIFVSHWMERAARTTVWQGNGEVRQMLELWYDPS
ncbi:UNVERIFIED_CONTAM: hypothetical protein K2H54_021945 [Gekko kuhli]